MSFDGAGKSSGLQIWRIEDFSPVPYAEENYGKFNVGDSYILLNTREAGGKFSWDLHFWLGAETTQDEAGSAAMLSVELDDQLGGAPVQHREVQENESAQFLSYFKKGVRYLPGGVKSGFKHYDPEEVEKRLFMVKGKKTVQVKEVELNVSSMNKSDCFILDCGKGKEILVYMPPGARKMEKFRAIQIANEIRDEDHAGHAHVEVLDEFSDDLSRFFEELGSGSPSEVPEAGAGDDEMADLEAARDIRLFRVSDDSVSEVGAPPLSQDMLDNKDAFILLGGKAGILVWVGKEASKEEKLKAITAATDFAKERKYPSNAKLQMVNEGLETAIFKQFFRVWNETDTPTLLSSTGVAEWNVSDLHIDALKRIEKAGGVAPGFMPDDGSGEKTIWRVENMDLVEMTEPNFLFSGDSYVILYKSGEGKSIVYFWQGAGSSTDEKGASAIHAARIDNEELDGRAVQVRVVEGQEPRHFYKMFGGNLVIFSGGKASGFNNVRDRDNYDEDGVRLFRVRGVGEDARDVRAEQVEEVAGSLSSDDVFILESGASTWIWKGKDSVAEELSAAQTVAGIVTPDKNPEVVEEGSEPDEFWAPLGGKGEYSPGYHRNKPILEPRLFHVIILPSGSVTAKEMFNFHQEDLVDDDVMILDTGREILLWIGNSATSQEKEMALDLAQSYLETDPSGYRTIGNTTIMVIKQGGEPANFTAAFPSWN